MKPHKAFIASTFSWVLIFFLTISLYGGKASSDEEHHVKAHEGPVVEKDQRRTLTVTEYGQISAIDVKEKQGAPPYHLQFFTLEPNSLFLPVLLHADMVFYVHTGSGKLTWENEHGTSTIPLRRGDLCSLSEGSVFHIKSNLEAERKKLRIYAMFAKADDNTYDPLIGAYSRINELVKGFDKKIMQAALEAPEDLVEAITNKTSTPPIVHAVTEKRNTLWELEASFLHNFLGIPSNSKKVKTYNIFDHDPDFKNRYGLSLAVTKKKLKSLKGNNIGFLMVNLTRGSMLGPHLNPRATEIAVVLQGQGMVRIVCGSSIDNNTECQNKSFKVKEGDVFVVPRFHPMAQMSFNNDSLVFLGFSTAAKNNDPQFLAGKGSMLEILDKQILATSLGVDNTTIEELLASQDESIIFGCSSCAEEEEKIVKEEIEKQKEEEEKRRREEEEAKKREEEEERKREEEKKRKEEEARREEERRREEKEAEKARKREEEEARREQEERERRREEEEARREKEAQRKEEEVRRERERRREEEAEREKEEAKRQQEKREKKREEEARREREREEEEEEEREEEEGRKQEKKEARRQQEERERRREEEKERARREQERRRREEEVAQREEEQIKRQEEKEQAKREQEKREKRREEEEAREEEEEEEEGKEEEARRKQERRREEEAEGEEEQAKTQEEEKQAKREQEKRERRREEEARKQEEETQEEQEQAERQQKKRERRREEEEERETEEEQVVREREGGRRSQEKGEQERETDNKSMHREVKGQSNGISFEGRRVLKIRNL